MAESNIFCWDAEDPEDRNFLISMLRSTREAMENEVEKAYQNGGVQEVIRLQCEGFYWDMSKYFLDPLLNADGSEDNPSFTQEQWSDFLLDTLPDDAVKMKCGFGREPIQVPRREAIYRDNVRRGVFAYLLKSGHFTIKEGIVSWSRST